MGMAALLDAIASMQRYTQITRSYPWLTAWSVSQICAPGKPAENPLLELLTARGIGFGGADDLVSNRPRKKLGTLGAPLRRNTD